jgi:hypothetical protein
MSIDITVDTSWSGPLAQPGLLEAEMRKLADDAVWEVGQQALAEVHLLLDRSIKHPTPYYETQIRMERIQSDVSVNDSGVVYGSWLEGVSSRNKTTRFKGYSSFRRAAQRVQGQIPILTDHVVDTHVRRMGG